MAELVLGTRRNVSRDACMPELPTTPAGAVPSIPHPPTPLCHHFPFG